MVLPTKKMRSSPTPERAQVGVGHLAGGEEPVGDRIGHHAVDLLRHGPVARADAAFHMRHRHAQLLRRDGAGHGRGDVAHHQAQVAAAPPAAAARSATMIAAVCSACVPDPTSRFTSGSGMPSWAKKSPDMRAS